MSANPYQQSTEYLTAKMPKITREQALRRVRGPAIGLISVSGVALALAAIGLLYTVVDFGIRLLEPVDPAANYVAPDPNVPKKLRDERRVQEKKMEAEANFLSLSTVFILSMSFVLANSIVLSGAIHMLHLRKHRASVAAAAMAIIPVLSPLLIVGIPFGVWAMIHLGNSEVKRYFV